MSKVSKDVKAEITRIQLTKPHFWSWILLGWGFGVSGILQEPIHEVSGPAAKFSNFWLSQKQKMAKVVTILKIK